MLFDHTTNFADMCYPLFSAWVARYFRSTPKKDLKLTRFKPMKRAVFSSPSEFFTEVEFSAPLQKGPTW